MEQQVDTLVIGAGPAGLAVAACLKKRGASCIIVDRATEVGSSWRRHYDRLHLHSDRDRSTLPYLSFPAGTPRYPSREQVIEYLEHYARHFELEPRFNEEVRAVRPHDPGWIATTTGGVYHSRQVVVATGYNAVPYVPRWRGQERFRGRILHSSEYRSGESFRGQSVLVVGLGNSGGEIAIDLHEHGARVAMAVRGPVNIVPREILGVPILAISIALNRLPARFADALAAPLVRLTIGDITKLGFRKLAMGPFTQIKATTRIPLIDIGTVKLVREGHIEVLGDIREMDGTNVIFDDERSQRFDAIVAATGYRPGSDCFMKQQSDILDVDQRPPPGGGEKISGLHYCGFVVSPIGMLHEIGIEAQRVADEITRVVHHAVV
ncbi:putative oxidoreductase CzcO (plasmid) [Caballeronia sp. SBC1]|uniref:flavin-containing monooxygenase n=1 Tax=unclassified Caballeronia TaxID=2646786 RepID=UPI0013E10A56|nr:MULTISPECIES: NAD(P)/FAD-dependent oxidoreductase [unclassified Caballeronia]QIE26590.1 putative oxidoreductase CzcO [Caballeronia sp. SBC2]QIN64094.1 putative oxidoreductase CzcO [Caballeronia sp. SBC1]